jgi:hypothetical protein
MSLLKGAEHLFFTIVWILAILVLAGLLLHLLNSRGLIPGFLARILSYTNIAAQAGS